jgi:hypothetical protein
MLMRYTAVALLFAALTASAVRAQSPPPKPPSSAQPEGQGWVEVPVNPRPDAPLRISVQVSRIADARWPSADWGHFRFRSSIENISHRDIGLFTIHNEAVGYDRHAGRPGGHSRLPGFSQPGKALRPGQVDVVEPPLQLLPSIWVSRLTVEVESVVFMDGTIWCTDECRIANYEAGNLAGGRAVVGRLLKVLERGGLDAVINALREKVAEDDPVPAVTVTTGELVDIKPPPGHTLEWEEGFRGATKSVADTLWEQYVHHGTQHIERTLRDAYRVEGEK